MDTNTPLEPESLSRRKPSRLTRAQRSAIERALRNAERAHAYIHRADYALCHRENMATTTLHYVRPSDGAVLYEVERSHGSDLVGLDTSIAELRALLGA